MNSNNGNPKKNNQGPGKPPIVPWINFLIIGIVITFLFNIIWSTILASNKVQIEYSQFVRLVENGAVETVQIEEAQILLKLKPEVAEASNVEEILGLTPPEDMTDAERQKWTENLRNTLKKEQVYYTGRVADDGLADRLLAAGVDFYTPIVETNPVFDFIRHWVIPIILIYAAYMLIMRFMLKRMGGGEGGIGGMMNVGKSNAKLYNMEKSTGVTFGDVAGQDEAKETLNEMMDFLHNPEKYQKIGAKQPKGALLVGPPGTGKTLLAKALAGEAHVPFYSLSGSEFVEMFVGVGAKRVRDLFEQAGKNAPCIIFIDEIDAIGKSRDNQMSSNDEREQTLNQLLSEMDGFDSSKGIVILAATNRPEVLDKALLRPGRFDRRVIVEKPDLPGREAILKVHANKVQLGEDVDLRAVALSTSGATGADLANMVNEAALRAVRMDRGAVMQEDLMESVEVVIAGKEKKDRILNPKEKRMVAYHEVGHALATALQKGTQPVQKITIVPRTLGALGYTMNAPEEERYLMTRSELEAQIVTLLAGRAAEETEFSEISTGASNDIERATDLARQMVTQYGMSERFGMVSLESSQNKYLDGRRVLNCSDATGAAIDDEVRQIIGRCHEEALRLMEDNREKLKEISEYLFAKETLLGDEFMRMLSESALPAGVETGPETA
ncbi:ATP-dependent zinc metalloprotease FtsH [Oscillospiraceae bacterium OttesenSCG-928-F05]|nr:ATP-dependent zinc metalloprotease FtsH [Oscillospiraceae bacterium OttesenSCG-928-F05]